MALYDNLGISSDRCEALLGTKGTKPILLLMFLPVLLLLLLLLLLPCLLSPLYEEEKGYSTYR